MREVNIKGEWAVTVAALAVGALPLAGQQPTGCLDIRDHGIGPSADSLLAIASSVADLEQELSAIWPGFWSVGQPFVLTVPGEAIVLVGGGRPAPPFERACVADRFPPLQGRAWVHGGALADLSASAGLFDLAYRSGDVVATAVPLQEGLEATLEFLVHEGFHAYQKTTFPPTVRNESADPENYADPEYTALAEVERRMLADALTTIDPDSVKEHLRAYLAVREGRLKPRSSIFRLTEAELETVEGTAQYVGMAARRLVRESAAAPLLDAAVEALRAPLVPSARLRGALARLRWMHRGRLYGTGVGLAILLDRFGADWRAGVEEGKALVRLLEGEVGYAQGCCDRLAPRALEAYGYDAILARTRAELRELLEDRRPGAR